MIVWPERVRASDPHVDPWSRWTLTLLARAAPFSAQSVARAMAMLRTDLGASLMDATAAVADERQIVLHVIVRGVPAHSRAWREGQIPGLCRRLRHGLCAAGLDVTALVTVEGDALHEGHEQARDEMGGRVMRVAR